MSSDKSKTTDKFLILFIATFIVYILIVFAKGAPVNAPTLGQGLGASLACTAIGYIVALIPASIYRLIKGQWPTWTALAAIPVIVLLLFIQTQSHTFNG